jgi:LuxR family maltose regulon positive regulatory protein
VVEDHPSVPNASSPLLVTKIQLPPLRQDLVARPDLQAKLVAGLTHPLTLVSAPAGFGKTTLLNSAAHTLTGDYRIAWLALDEEDNDVLRFLQYLLAAVDVAVPGLSATAAAALRSTQPPPPQQVLVLLFNALSAAPSRLMIVLDDYHVIDTRAIHQALEYVVDHLPVNARLVIATRSDPPLPLPRLRGRGLVTEIRTADLQFSINEADAFLGQVMRLRLSPEDLALLETRTEGWVAGLQMAGLSLQGRADAERFVTAFAGSNRYIVDYLMTEVVGRQPEAIQRFLLLTSILDRMCADLCDAVLADTLPAPSENADDSMSILERLEQGNVFTVPLDDDRYWYRYHHLFADFLRSRLRRSQPTELARLHRKASTWFAGQGLGHEAIKHALATGDFAFAAETIERLALAMIYKSETQTVLNWLGNLPEAEIVRRPALCVYHAWALAFTQQAERRGLCEERLRQAEQLALAPEHTAQRAWLAGHIVSVRAYQSRIVGINGGDPRPTIALSEEARRLLPPDDTALHGMAALNIAYARLALCDPGSADAALIEAERLGLAGRNHFAAANAATLRARLAQQMGQLGRAERLYEEARATYAASAGPDGRTLPIVGALDIGLGGIALERDRLAEAETLILRGLNLVQWTRGFDLPGYGHLARLREVQRDMAGALAAVKQLETAWPDGAVYIQALRGQMQMRNPAAIASLTQAPWVREAEPLPLLREEAPGLQPWGQAQHGAHLAWARAQTILGRPHPALAYVERQLALAQERGLGQRVIELSIVQALTFHALGENRRALEAVQRALVAGEPEGYIHIYNQGPDFERLLAEAAARGIAGGCASRLLTTFGVAQTAPDVAEPRSERPELPTLLVLSTPEGESLLEPLSDRELEVLRLIAEGLANAQIAAQLYIEVGTVKRHVNHIFGKLGVASRTQALARARALKLL